MSLDTRQLKRRKLNTGYDENPGEVFCYRCTQCGQRFQTEGSKKSHVRREHQDKASIGSIQVKRSSLGVFSCPFPGCSKEMGNANSLQTHFKRHGAPISRYKRIESQNTVNEVIIHVDTTPGARRTTSHSNNGKPGQTFPLNL